MSRFVQDAPLTKCAEGDSIKYRKRMKRFHGTPKGPPFEESSALRRYAQTPPHQGSLSSRGGFRTSTYYIKENPP